VICPAIRDFTCTLSIASTFPTAAISRGTSWDTARTTRTGTASAAEVSTFADTRVQDVSGRHANIPRRASLISRFKRNTSAPASLSLSRKNHPNAAGDTVIAGNSLNRATRAYRAISDLHHRHVCNAETLEVIHKNAG
jgi:voltage-gated potassium channel Kch